MELALSRGMNETCGTTTRRFLMKGSAGRPIEMVTQKRPPFGLSASILVGNEARYLGAVRRFMHLVIEECPIRPEEAYVVTLAVDEAVANVMEHGYGMGKPGFVRVEIEIDDREFKAVVSDRGTYFDPTALPPLDVQAHVQNGRSRGLGVFMIRKLMEQVEYRVNEDGENELVLQKQVERV